MIYIINNNICICFNMLTGTNECMPTICVQLPADCLRVSMYADAMYADCLRLNINYNTFILTAFLGRYDHVA